MEGGLICIGWAFVLSTAKFGVFLIYLVAVCI
jgi:hypothetical protein